MPKLPIVLPDPDGFCLVQARKEARKEPKFVKGDSYNPQWLVAAETESWLPLPQGKAAVVLSADAVAPEDDETADPADMAEWLDWDGLYRRFVEAGIPARFFPADYAGLSSEQSILYHQTLCLVEKAEADHVFEPELDWVAVNGRQVEIRLEADRIRDLNAWDRAFRLGAARLNEIWLTAKNLEVCIASDGTSIVSIRAKNGLKLTMPLGDFSRFLSVPAVNGGYSKIFFPALRPGWKEDETVLWRIFANLTLNGQPLGGDEDPKIHIMTGSPRQDFPQVKYGPTWIDDMLLNNSLEPKLWHLGLIEA